ncbi:AMP-binding protein [Streptomyces poriferorum]|uniref:AMP-binding protein n=1 Tax=Streptomyces poriferorum TaxID=2798799 RepID=UPI00273F8D84|nr:AMP-binding protein [Streptomyces sp. Alt1]WLQ51078.1 AMP-binding protein [Streptomyces sp. Alt1]
MENPNTTYAPTAHGNGGTVHSLLDDAAVDTPDGQCLHDAAGQVTYRRMAELSHGFAAWLTEQGAARGDRLVVQLPSRRELVAMVYGASRAGVILVPLNPAMKEYHLRSVIEDAEPSLIIGDGPTTEVLGRAAALPVHDLAEIWPHVEEAAGRPAAAPLAISADDIAFLVYTSGSTAAPKAVVCPHAQVTFASRAIQEVLGYRPDDVVFCRFPISWDYGLYKVLLACLGRSQLVLDGGESDLVLLRRMRETGATVVPIVPSLAAMIGTLAARDAQDPPPVRMFTNTGAALPDHAVTALREAFPGVRVVRQFGQTECKRVSIMPPDREHERPQSVGLPLPGTTVLILDAQGRPLPAGETGEIVAVGPHVMPGYWRRPELSARTFRPDPDTGAPRLHTGDYGRLDEDGYLYFEGRRDDMFKRKGIRMSTVEIEAAAMDIPGVRTATALPPTGTRDLVIFAETDLAPHTVLKELAERLEPAKVPALCRVLDELPLSLHGKNARQVLTEMIDGEAR